MPDQYSRGGWGIVFSGRGSQANLQSELCTLRTTAALVMASSHDRDPLDICPGYNGYFRYRPIIHRSIPSLNVSQNHLTMSVQHHLDDVENLFGTFIDSSSPGSLRVV